jgi:hypothetical protein
MSPTVWVPEKVPSGFALTGFWKNQKPSVVEPLLS